MAQKYNTIKNHGLGTWMRSLTGWRHRGREGFTIIELVVVIVVLGILMSLAIVNVINSQATGRDVEREEDAQAIARHFEGFYDSYTNPFTGDQAGSYPGQVQVTFAADEVVDGIDRRSFFAPGVTVTDDYSNMSLVGATNTNETPSGVLPQPGAGNDKYVYQALKPDNTICEFTGEYPDACVRFNLYYWNEANNEVRKITSRNQ